MEIGEVQMQFAELIWKKEPIASGELVKLCADEFGWKKSTTYTILRKLVSKGMAQNEDAVVTVLVALEKALLTEVAEGSHIRNILDATADRQVVGVLVGHILIDGANPVAVGAAVAEIGDLLRRKLGAAARVDGRLVVEFGVDPGIDDSWQGCSLLDTVAHVILHVDDTLFVVTRITPLDAREP